MAETIDSVATAFQVLEVLVHAPEPMGVSQIARRLDVPRARVHRHLSTLSQLGYVEQEHGTERYRTSAKIWMLGQVLSARFDARSIIRPALETLRDELGRTTALSAVSRDGVEVLENFHGRHVFDISARPGSKLPFHASAQGKIALAFGPPQLLKQCLKQELHRYTPKTICEPKKLEAEIERVRHQGWAASPEELELGFNALAGPVLGPDRNLLFTFGALDVIQSMPSPPTDEQIRQIKLTAEQMFQKLSSN